MRKLLFAVLALILVLSSACGAKAPEETLPEVSGDGYTYACGPADSSAPVLEEKIEKNGTEGAAWYNGVDSCPANITEMIYHLSNLINLSNTCSPGSCGSWDNAENRRWTDWFLARIKELSGQKK